MPDLSQDPVGEATRDLRSWKVHVKRGEAKRFIEALIQSSADKGSDVLVVNSDMVFGEDHLRSALYHAAKAMAEGRAASESLAMETLLYASGERQLSSAVKKMRAPDEAEAVVVASLSGGLGEQTQRWEPLPQILDAHPEKLKRFGISEEEIATLAGRRPEELVLEKVAAVDTIKK